MEVVLVKVPCARGTEGCSPLLILACTGLVQWTMSFKTVRRPAIPVVEHISKRTIYANSCNSRNNSSCSSINSSVRIDKAASIDEY